MASVRHSLQPWSYEIGIVYSSDGEVVADNVGVLDGPVIATAPKLLDCLEECLHELRRLGGADPRVVERADAAIADARTDLRKLGREGH